MQFLHIKVYQNFCAFYIFLTLSGPGGGGGGGLQGLDDQIQKLLTLWCANLVTFSFYL